MNRSFRQAEPMKSHFHKMNRLSHGNSIVLIHEESSTGKELIARAIHAQSA